MGKRKRRRREEGKRREEKTIVNKKGGWYNVRRENRSNETRLLGQYVILNGRV